jgi:endonuclease/exonuclease/phosphatase family metal-dependent hydrolase
VSATQQVEFTVSAFNAHWGVGRFGDERGERFNVAKVVRSFDAEIVVVAESWRDDDGAGILDPLLADGYKIETVEQMPLVLRRDATGLRDAAPREGLWEMSVCTRFPVLSRREISLDDRRTDLVYSRRALLVTIEIARTPVEVIAIHTSSKVWRLAPVRHLLSAKRQMGKDVPQILAGDFNFWGPPVAALFRGWRRPVRGRTYPSHRPHSQIDHVLVRGGIKTISGEVLPVTPSDHLPVRARLRMP